jgi:acetoin:2,6-dichlorophenolindophenol oxidoreductase subunit beta
MTFRDAINLALADEMEADPSVFVFGLDVDDHKRIFGSTRGLVEKFGPSRCFGTPLCEEALTGIALGAAVEGLKPVLVHIRTDFLLLGTNQIINMISCLRYLSGGKLAAPLVIRAVIGRGWGQAAQHSKSLHGMFAHIPGLKVVLPGRPQDAYTLLRGAIQDPDPVIFLEHRWLYDVDGPVEKDRPASLALNGSEVLQEGDAITIVTTSWMSVEALKAAEVLGRSGVHLEVVAVKVAAPLEVERIVASVRKTGRCIVADYDWTFCGFSSELAAQISEACFHELKSPVRRLGFAHAPCPGTRPLENLFYPSAVQIIRETEKILGLSAMDLSGESFYTYEENFRGPF